MLNHPLPKESFHDRLIPTAKDNIRHVSDTIRMVAQANGVFPVTYGINAIRIACALLNLNKIYEIRNFSYRIGQYLDGGGTGSSYSNMPVIKGKLLQGEGIAEFVNNVAAGNQYKWQGVLNNPDYSIANADVHPWDSDPTTVPIFSDNNVFQTAGAGVPTNGGISSIKRNLVYQDALNPFGAITQEGFWFKSGNANQLIFFIDPSMGQDGSAFQLQASVFLNYDLVEYDFAR